LLFGVTGALASLPFIHTDISVKATGIIRPVSERTEVKPVISGIINRIYYKEGDTVRQNEIILNLKDPNTKSKKLLNNYEINQKKQFIKDLQTLSNIDFSKQEFEFKNIVNQLNTPLYKEQAIRFLHQKEEQDILLKKATKEVEMNTSLAKDKVISPKEFFDFQMQEQRQQSARKALMQEQLISWQQDLAKYKLELSQYQQQTNQIITDASYYEVKAPVSGVIQGINNRYTGGYLQADETICNISPEGGLIGECYVQTKDVGLLKPGQTTRYQIEAFDYNYFGVLTGKIIAIDNDFTVVNNTPVIKVRCSFDSIQLHLKNGFTGQLKKGLNFQASFIVSRRSLWQLLWDKMDDWLNPSSPLKVSA
jgi:HlyD family secretion protein